MTAHLAWSGNHQFGVHKNQLGLQYMCAGEALIPGEIVLEKNESYQSPKLFVAYSDSGLNGLRSQMQQQARSIVKFPEGNARPVLINTWEALYFDHDIEKQNQLARVAQEIGVERYVLDDGWFLSRRNDRAGLGDWWIDDEIYPQGFTPLLKVLQQNKLEFGLWFEPEMVNEDSTLFREHPEWLLEQDHQEQKVGRNQ